MPVTSWTIAHRKPSANRIVRVGGIALTWDEARTLAAQLGHVRPDLQVYYVPTLAAEVAGYVVAEDRGNILMHTGKRVRMVDTGTLDAFPPLGDFHAGPGITVLWSARPVTMATCICGWSADLSGPMSGHDEAAEDLYLVHLAEVAHRS